MTDRQTLRGLQLPLYQCHKVVGALKIKQIDYAPDGTGTLTPMEDFPPVPLDRDFLRRHNPQPGGYFVMYDDGYQSFSPALAFEAGYTRVPEGQEGT